MYFFYLNIISPWRKESWSFIRKNFNFLHPSKDAFCQVLLKLVQWFRRRWWKSEKNTIWTTNNQKISFRKTQLSIRLRWAKKCSIILNYLKYFFSSFELFLSRKWNSMTILLSAKIMSLPLKRQFFHESQTKESSSSGEVGYARASL